MDPSCAPEGKDTLTVLVVRSHSCPRLAYIAPI